jgi:exodeoxyribonuclease V alpha subunit
VVPGVFSVVGTRYHNPETGYLVLSVRPPSGKEVFTAICTTPSRIIEGMSIEVEEGRWVKNKKYGRQFHIGRLSIPEPASVFGVATYLASGIIRAVGHTLAKRIVRKLRRTRACCPRCRIRG